MSGGRGRDVLAPVGRIRSVLYMAHPLGGDVDGNIKRALRWLAWLRKSFPDATFVAPWIAGVLSGEDDADPAQREAGLVDCCATVAHLDGVVLVGGRISSGMERERDTAESAGLRVANLISIGPEAPTDLYTFAVHGPVPYVLGRAHYEPADARASNNGGAP